MEESVKIKRTVQHKKYGQIPLVTIIGPESGVAPAVMTLEEWKLLVSDAERGEQFRDLDVLAIENLKRAVKASLPLFEQYGLFITYERLKEALELCEHPREKLLVELLNASKQVKNEQD